MSNIIQPPLEYEIDVRKIILTILHRWKFLITTILLAGIAAAVISVLQPPVYEYSITIQVDSNILPFVDPSTLLVSYPVYQKTNELMGLVLDPNIITNKTNNKLPNITIQVDSSNKTLYTITVQAKTAQSAEQIANKWTDQGILLINEKIQSVFTIEKIKLEAFEVADKALVEFLQFNNLSQLTWTDIEIITGVSNPNIFLLNPQILPAISISQRLKISSLMLARISAENEYNSAKLNADQVQSFLDNNEPAVDRRTTLPGSPINRSRIKINIAMGGIAGLIFAVLWIFLQEWWLNGKNEKA